MRRGRDRYKQRREALLRHLVRLGLFPPSDDKAGRAKLQDRDPFAMRARALDHALTPHELGRVLFHLNQRRGFRSNRKADRRDNESGKIQLGVSRLVAAMGSAGVRTFGEFLHLRRLEAEDDNHIPSVRTRLRPETGNDAKGTGYEFYPSRALLEDEFDEIVRVQKEHHPALLTEETCGLLFDVIFHQRPLKAPKVGLCTLLFETGELRLPKAHPLFQRRRLLEELNALKIARAGQVAQPVSREQRDLLLLKLKGSKAASFETLRTKVLKLDPAARFNKESENRKELKGDEVAAVMGAKTRFGPRWALLSPDAQWEVVHRVREAESEADVAALHDWLHAEHRLTPEAAKAVADAPLPDGYGRFGETATRRLIEALMPEKPGGGLPVYSEAVEIAGLGHHSDRRTGEVFDELPYYGRVLAAHVTPGSGDPAEKDDALRYGRLTNPTVHIGLNQLKRVLNTLIRRYGKPAEVALEITRELKLTEEEKARRNRENADNRTAAQRRSKKLEELGVADKGGNRAILKLWEELNPANAFDRRCVYTGEQISMHMLFSGAVEVDHILPFARTLDDSQANRILCLREANRAKRKRTPFEAFGHTAEWGEIAARAARLPQNKRWRFEPDALSRFDGQEDGFLARHLVDTQHLSRLARQYVSKLYDDETGEGSSHVWVSPGRLTEMFRRSWGLNSLLPDHNFAGGADQPKNRADHRHHAIDAAVVAVTDRALLQRLAREAGQKGHEEARRLAHDLDPPWEGFREELARRLADTVASHKPDHGTPSKAGLPRGRDATAGRLHNDTAYGFTGRQEDGTELVVHRVPLEALKPDHLADRGRRVADPHLRKLMRAATAGTEGKAFTEALRRFGGAHPEYAGVRRVRVVEPLSVIPVRDKAGRAYKGYKGDSNHRCDVWALPGDRWTWEVVSMFDAHQPGWTSPIRRDHHNPRKILSLHTDDVLACERAGERRLLRVVKFSANQLVLAPPNESGDLKRRHEAADDPFRYVFVSSASGLKAMGARRVRIDEVGRVLDPGPLVVRAAGGAD